MDAHTQQRQPHKCYPGHERSPCHRIWRPAKDPAGAQSVMRLRPKGGEEPLPWSILNHSALTGLMELVITWFKVFPCSFCSNQVKS